MSKTLKQLQSYLKHYQDNYPRANSVGKALIRFHLNKLSRQIKRLQTNSDRRAVLVIVNKEEAHHTPSN